MDTGPEVADAWVRKQTARQLIPLEAPQPWRSCQGTVWHQTEELGVTQDALLDRLRTVNRPRWDCKRSGV